MTFDRKLFAVRLQKSRQAFALSISELGDATDISQAELESYESATVDPKGDHVLILADFLRCDYRYLIDATWPDTFANTSILFRAHGQELTKADRQAIQETLLLAENEVFLQRELSIPITHFSFSPSGNYLKGHGQTAATELRKALGYTDIELRRDIFADLRKIGLHVFRRRLNNEKISGLFLDHPTGGKCIIVNYDEDLFRQRFTGAHEAGHAILDNEATFNVSFDWRKTDLKEVRANAFASFLLIPPDFAGKLPSPQAWSREDTVNWASKLMLSTRALAVGLKEHGLIDESQFNFIAGVKVPRETKTDPELPATLSAAKRTAKIHAMERGLSAYYVELSLEAYKRKLISRGRLCEMLLCDEGEVISIAELFGRTLVHGD